MTETRLCKICGGELEEGNTSDICYSDQALVSNMNMYN